MDAINRRQDILEKKISQLREKDAELQLKEKFHEEQKKRLQRKSHFKKNIIGW